MPVEHFRCLVPLCMCVGHTSSAGTSGPVRRSRCHPVVVPHGRRRENVTELVPSTWQASHPATGRSAFWSQTAVPVHHRHPSGLAQPPRLVGAPKAQTPENSPPHPSDPPTLLMLPSHIDNIKPTARECPNCPNAVPFEVAYSLSCVMASWCFPPVHCYSTQSAGPTPFDGKPKQAGTVVWVPRVEKEDPSPRGCTGFPPSIWGAACSRLTRYCARLNQLEQTYAVAR